jgi:hypothetical protein
VRPCWATTEVIIFEGVDVPVCEWLVVYNEERRGKNVYDVW